MNLSPDGTLNSNQSGIQTLAHLTLTPDRGQVSNAEYDRSLHPPAEGDQLQGGSADQICPRPPTAATNSPPPVSILHATLQKLTEGLGTLSFVFDKIHHKHEYPQNSDGCEYA